MEEQKIGAFGGQKVWSLGGMLRHSDVIDSTLHLLVYGDLYLVPPALDVNDAGMLTLGSIGREPVLQKVGCVARLVSVAGNRSHYSQYPKMTR